MLKFYDYSVTNSLEVPNEVCLCFHIAECQNRCNGCFSKELWESSDINLSDVYRDIMLAYSKRITCVCFSEKEEIPTVNTRNLRDYARIYTVWNSAAAYTAAGIV